MLGLENQLLLHKTAHPLAQTRGQCLVRESKMTHVYPHHTDVASAKMPDVNG